MHVTGRTPKAEGGAHNYGAGGDPRRRIPLTDDQRDFVQENMGLAYSWARRSTLRGESFDEILGACFSGLVRACQSYEPEKGKFSTYAVSHMRREIQVLRKQQSAESLVLPWSKPSRGEVKRVTEAGVLESLTASVTRSERIEESFSEDIEELMDYLCDRDREVLRLRFVVGMCRPEIGNILGVSSQRIFEIEGRAIRHLKVLMKIKGVEKYL